MSRVTIPISESEIPEILPKMQNRVSASTQVYEQIRNHHRTHLLPRQRTSQTLQCYAAFGNGLRWKAGMGNASSPTDVRWSYQVRKTWMLTLNYKITNVLL